MKSVFIFVTVAHDHGVKNAGSREVYPRAAMADAVLSTSATILLEFAAGGSNQAALRRIRALCSCVTLAMGRPVPHRAPPRLMSWAFVWTPPTRQEQVLRIGAPTSTLHPLISLYEN